MNSILGDSQLSQINNHFYVQDSSGHVSMPNVCGRKKAVSSMMHVLAEESGAGEQRQQVDFLGKARKDERLMFPQKSK